MFLCRSIIALLPESLLCFLLLQNIIERKTATNGERFGKWSMEHLLTKAIRNAKVRDKVFTFHPGLNKRAFKKKLFHFHAESQLKSVMFCNQIFQLAFSMMNKRHFHCYRFSN